MSYLLISGQACVLYGAATFSEDVDVWVDPRAANLARLRAALARVGATYYKLTPPLEEDLARAGHGFHFLLGDPGAFGPVYLDVLGQPPRVGRFPAARRRAEVIASDWGAIPVVAVPELVELKLTQRLADYDVVSNLVGIRVRRTLESGGSRRGLARWALTRMFRAEGLLELLEGLPRARDVATRLGRPALAPLLRREPDLEEASGLLAAEVAQLQNADRRYWKPIVEDLRTLRRAGGLVKIGTPVERD